MSIDFQILVEVVRNSVVGSAVSPVVAPNNDSAVTVLVEDTLDAELQADIDCLDTDQAEDVDENDVIDDETGGGDQEQADRAGCSSDSNIASDVEMKDLSEQGLDAVADLFD